MKKINKIIISIIAFLGMILFPIDSNAASGSLKISGTSTAVVGNTITINVTLSSSAALGAWEFDVNYDTSFLKLTSSNAENNGTYFVNAGNGSMKSKTYTLKFRTLKSGSTNITIGGYDIYAYDTSKMSISKSNKKVTIMTQAELEATYSKDNYLKSLSVEGYELDKEFAKETTEYTVNFPTGTTSVKVNATVNDSRSSVSGIGEITVSEGLNNIPIVVTAQNGSERTYNLTINVEDQNPINVTVGNDAYVIVKTASLLTTPATFIESSITIDSIEIPAFINEKANLTLVGLKSSDGTIGLFIYNDGKYSKYNEMNLNQMLLIPVPFTKELDFTKTTANINGEEVEAYKYSDKSDFVIISTKSLVDGKTNLYLYDTKNNTAILYDEELINMNNNTLKLYTYVIIAFAGAFLLMLIIIMILLHSSKKKQKKINKFIEKQEAKIEATRKLNDVVSEVQKITAVDKKTQNKKAKGESKLEETKNNEAIKKEDTIIVENKNKKNENKINENKKDETKKSKNKEKEEAKEEINNEEVKIENISQYENGELTSILEALNTDKDKEETAKIEVNKSELSKKELKELKKLEKRKAKEAKKNKKKELQNIVDKEEVIDNVLDDTEEIYDLFADDKKKKKK